MDIALVAIAPAVRMGPVGSCRRCWPTRSRWGGCSPCYALARPAADISIREVLEAVDGPDLFHRCIFVSETYQANPCPLHDTWTPIMALTIDAMERATLADLATEVGE